MKWQEVLKKLESLQEWDMAIAYMQEVIEKDSDSVDAYLSFLYLLMSILVYEDYDRSKRNYYAGLCKKYFDESYEKFNNNPEYLYYAGRIAVMSEWYFGLEIEECNAMIKKAFELAPDNPIYQLSYYSRMNQKNKFNNKNLQKYVDLILDSNSIIKKELLEKGSLGEYLLDLMYSWAKRIKNKESI